MKSSEPNREDDYESLVKQFSSSLYRYAYRLSACHDASEELVQETFFEAWKYLRDKSVEFPQAFLFKILNRRFARWLDSHSRSLLSEAGDVDEQTLPGNPDSLDSIDQRDLVQVALGRLEENARQVILLVMMEGLTCEQASEILEIPKGTVLSRLHRGKQELKKVLARLSERNPSEVTNHE